MIRSFLKGALSSYPLPFILMIGITMVPYGVELFLTLDPRLCLLFSRFCLEYPDMLHRSFDNSDARGSG